MLRKVSPKTGLTPTVIHTLHIHRVYSFTELRSLDTKCISALSGLNLSVENQYKTAINSVVLDLMSVKHIAFKATVLLTQTTHNG